MPCARQRDVHQAEVFAAFFDLRLPLMRGERGAGESHVDRAHVVGVAVVEEHRVRAVRDVTRLPEERGIDDREFESLAAMDRQDLNGFSVGFESPAAFLVRRVLIGLGDAPAQPGGEGGRPHLLGHRGLVKKLCDVTEIREPALTVLRGQQPFRQSLGEHHRLRQIRDALHPQHPRPVVQPFVHEFPVALVLQRDLLGRTSQEDREGC